MNGTPQRHTSIHENKRNLHLSFTAWGWPADTRAHSPQSLTCREFSMRRRSWWPDCPIPSSPLFSSSPNTNEAIQQIRDQDGSSYSNTGPYTRLPKVISLVAAWCLFPNFAQVSLVATLIWPSTVKGMLRNVTPAYLGWHSTSSHRLPDRDLGVA